MNQPSRADRIAEERGTGSPSTELKRQLREAGPGLRPLPEASRKDMAHTDESEISWALELFISLKPHRQSTRLSL